MGIINDDPTAPYVKWVSPDGAVYEFRYIVTQTEDEGPERLEFRKVGDIFPIAEGRIEDWMEWSDLPEDQGEPPKEVMEHFHGRLIAAGEVLWGFPAKHTKVNEPFALVKEYWWRLFEVSRVDVNWPPFSGIPETPSDLFPRHLDLLGWMVERAIETELDILTQGTGELKSSADWSYQIDGAILMNFIQDGEYMLIHDEAGRPLPDWANAQLTVAAHNAAKRVAASLQSVLMP